LEGVADIAIPIAAGANQYIDRILRAVVEARCGIESTTEIAPADVLLVEASPMVRKKEGGSAVPSLIPAVLISPLDRKPGLVLLIM